MKQNTSLERIIAKIDNDFNLDNSDWIPRVGAWVIDAMSMLNCLRTELKRKSIPVKERIAYAPCNAFNGDFKVFDTNGCRIKEAKSSKCCNSPSFTGGETQTNTTGTTDYMFNPTAEETTVQAVTVNSKDYNNRYNYINLKKTVQDYNYVKIDCDKIELNFDTNEIIIEYYAIATYKSTMYGCELPVIPDNGLLIEAIAYYCLYKMLCRGYKHPVFNLHASQYGTNPYYIWKELQDKAKRSVIIDEQGKTIDDGGLWRSSFFINTFNSRD